MNRTLTSALLAAGALLALPAEAAPRSVTILHVNDTHSRLDSWGPKDHHLDGTLGGLSKAATVISAAHAAEPAALLVHGGDLFHGDLYFQAFFGVPELEILGQLGLTAMAVGNHEFEWGPDVLAGSLTAAFPSGESPVISANLDLSAYPPLQQLVRPSVLRDAGGVRVGFFGLTTPYDPIEQPAPVVVGDDLAGTAALQAAELRAAGAEVVVMVSHLGVDLDEQIVSAVGGVDLVIAAHDHRVLTQAIPVASPSGTTWIVEAGSFYRWVGRVRLTVDGGKVTLADYRLLPVDADVPRLPELLPAITGLKQEIVARYGDVFHTPIAFALGPFSSQQDPSSAIRDTDVGDLLTDIYRERGHTDVAIEAMGLMDDGIPAGWVVGADVFRTESYGYDPATGLNFPLATVKMTGADMLLGIEMGLAMPGDFFLQVSGMRFRYDSCLPAGARVLHETVHVGGKRLDPARLYSVTLSETALAALPALGVPVRDVVVLPEPEYSVAAAAIRERALLIPWGPDRIRNVGYAKCGN
jgi:5'-nucleotidase